MAWGFFKKIVIADTLSKYISLVYDAPHNFFGFSLILATIFFTLQIYCDFSGYSDIAIGTSKLFGMNLMANFRSPYFSQSIKEFWSRWHISLSTWFRDYVYIPLGGNQVGKLRHIFNLIFTFLASGLWHGANWTFVIWGGIHGIAQVLENFLLPKKQGSKGIVWLVRVFIVFLFTSFAWIFFVSDSVSDAFYVILHAFTGISSPLNYLRQGFVSISLDKVGLAYLIASLLILFVYDYISLKTDVIELISSKNTVIRWIIYLCFLLWIIMNAAVSNQAAFIYFQF